MNDRIKQLALQASKDNIDGYPVTLEFSTRFSERFAELMLLDLISGINGIQTANKCVYTTFDKSIADCVKTEIIKLIETTYNVKVPYANS